ncbi:MAG: hypothetical protein E7493_13735 [Ruminococcus albus]|nr:hypothetical protein [Ruminococcus albus]
MNEENKSIKGTKSYIVETVFIAVVMMLAVFLIILFGASTGYAIAVLGIVWLLVMRSKRKKGITDWQENTKRIIIFVLAAGLMNLFPFLSMAKTGGWRYPFERSYVEMRHTSTLPEWFPKELPDSAKNCRMDYTPSIMQGTGFFTAGFECSDEECAKWEEFGKERAKYIIPLEEYQTDESFDIAGYETELAVKTDTSGSHVEVGKMSAIWDGNESGAKIYVINTNLDLNRPHNETVIVGNGRVQLFAE